MVTFFTGLATLKSLICPLLVLEPISFHSTSIVKNHFCSWKPSNMVKYPSILIHVQCIHKSDRIIDGTSILVDFEPSRNEKVEPTWYYLYLYTRATTRINIALQL